MIRLLEDRVMILPYSEEEVLEGTDVSWDSDSGHVPRATVVAVSEQLTKNKELLNVPEVGDKVLFNMPREKGQHRYNGKIHNIVSIGAIVAIL